MNNKDVNQLLDNCPKHADALKIHSGKHIRKGLQKHYSHYANEASIYQQDAKFDKAMNVTSPEDQYKDKYHAAINYKEAKNIRGIQNKIKPSKTYSDFSVDEQMNKLHKDKTIKPLDKKGVLTHIEYARMFHKQPGINHDLVNDKTTQQLINGLHQSPKLSHALNKYQSMNDKDVKNDNSANKSNHKRNMKNQNHRINKPSHVMQKTGPSLE